MSPIKTAFLQRSMWGHLLCDLPTQSHCSDFSPTLENDDQNSVLRCCARMCCNVLSLCLCVCVCVCVLTIFSSSNTTPDSPLPFQTKPYSNSMTIKSQHKLSPKTFPLTRPQPNSTTLPESMFHPTANLSATR